MALLSLYAFVRAESILNKARKQGYEIDYDINLQDITEDEFIMKILKHIDSINSVLSLAIKLEDPSKISEWTIEVAQYFMKFYERYPVISSKKQETKLRLLLVKIIHQAIRSGLDILGIHVVKSL